MRYDEEDIAAGRLEKCAEIPVVSGWWEAANDTGSLMIVSEQFLKDNPDLFINTYAKDREDVYKRQAV